MFTGGVRAHYAATVLAVPLLRPGALVVTVSFFPGSYPSGDDQVAYSVAKAADDRLVAVAAAQLKPRGVAAVSLYPGLVAPRASCGRRSISICPIRSHRSSSAAPSSRWRTTRGFSTGPAGAWSPRSWARSTASPTSTGGARSACVRTISAEMRHQAPDLLAVSRGELG
jgi:NAD(P)-dependent dehydrogenase (short-subunit alcohol dehydrogenase family)